MKRAMHLFLSAAITAALCWTVFRELTVAEFLQQFRGASKPLIAVYAGLAIVGIFLRAARSRLLLRCYQADAAPSLAQLTTITAVRNALVDFFPARIGELSSIYLLSRIGVAVSIGTAALGVSFVFDLLMLPVMFACFYGAHALLFSPAAGSGAATSDVPLWSIPVFLVVVAILLTVLRFAPRIIIAIANLIERQLSSSLALRLVALLRELSEGWAAMSSSRSLAPLALLTLALRLTKYAGLYLLLLGFLAPHGYGIEQLNPVVTIASFLLAEAAASLPISGLMGFGVYEGVWSAVFTKAGIVVPSLTGLILALHLTSQIVGYSLGLLGFVVFSIAQLQKGQTNKGSKASKFV